MPTYRLYDGQNLLRVRLTIHPAPYGCPRGRGRPRGCPELGG
jgi:hypothetical protein